MLHIKNLSVSFADNDILNGLDLDLSAGEVLALIGPNGSGKTTLLRIIRGEISPSSGSVQLEEDLDSAYVPQEPVEFSGTVKEYLLGANTAIFKAYKKMENSREEPLKYAEYVNEYYTARGFELEDELATKLSEYGFSSLDQNRKFNEFSQGQKRLFSVIKALLTGAKLFLFDEPTNHLDIEMTLEFECTINNLAQSKMGVVVASHDRAFIDTVADKTVYLKGGESFTVRGGYSAMLEHLEVDFKSRERRAGEIERKIRQLESDVLRRKSWSDSKESSKRDSDKLIDKGNIGHRAAKQAKRALTIQRRTQKLIEELKEKKPFVEKPLVFAQSSGTTARRKMVRAEDLTFSYGGETVVTRAWIDIDTTDRLGIIGANGSGKTTLMKCLVGLLEPSSGRVYRNDNVRWNYLPQDVIKTFERETLLDEFEVCEIEGVQLRRDLANIGLKGERVLGKISTLSYGELMRAAVLKAVLLKSEFIFMDEPTNHLDIESLEILDRLLENFSGGFLFISHDRRFIAEHGSKVLMMDRGALNDFRSNLEINPKMFNQLKERLIKAEEEAEIRRKTSNL